METSDYLAFLRALPALYETRALPDLPHAFLEFLSHFVPSDAIAYNDVNLKTGHIDLVTNPLELRDSKYVRVLEQFIAQHPLIEYQQRTGDTSARKTSDLISTAQYHETAVYREAYRHINAEDQFALTVRMNSDIIGAIVMNRDRRSFSETDRQLLNLAQPHLIQAYRNAETFTKLQQPLAGIATLAEALPHGLILLDRRFRILFSTERARKLLASYFPKSRPARVLPQAVRSWISQACKLHGQALPNALRNFSLKTPAGNLSIRSVRKSGSEETILTLHETGVPHSAASLRTLGLTAREAEVLLWISHGKSNSEIAIILGIAPRTIQKHVEHIFAKLRVETRTEAAREAMDVFNSDFP